jgi:hypothetical protein
MLATATPAGTSGESGWTTHRFTSDAVRDVAFAVSDYDLIVRDLGSRASLGNLASGTRIPPEVGAAEIEDVLL